MNICPYCDRGIECRECDRLQAALDAETKGHLEDEAKSMALIIGLKNELDAANAERERLREALLVIRHRGLYDLCNNGEALAELAMDALATPSAGGGM